MEGLADGETRKNYKVSYITQIIKASRYKVFPTSELEAINLLTTGTKAAVMSQTLISKHGSTPEASARAISLQNGSMHGVTERQLSEDHQRKISCSTKVARKTKQGHLSLQLTVNSEVTGSKPT